MTIREHLLDEWDREIAMTRQLLSSLAGTDLAHVPAGASGSVAQFVDRIVGAVSWGPLVLDRFEFDLAEETPSGRAITLAAALDAFEQSATATRRLLQQSDAEWRAIWSLKRSGKPQFSMPRITAFRRFVMSRLIHRRGELSVHVTGTGILSPAFYVALPDEE